MESACIQRSETVRADGREPDDRRLDARIQLVPQSFHVRLHLCFADRHQPIQYYATIESYETG